MKLRILGILLAVCMLMGLVACGGGSSTTEEAEPATTEAVEEAAAEDTEAVAAAEDTQAATEDTDVYEQMKSIYTMAAAGQGSDGFYYIFAYDDNVDNGIFIILDEEGKSSVNLVGPITQEDPWLTITDSSNNNTYTFGLKDMTDKGFTMVAQKNEEEIPMEFCDPSQAIDVIKAIDQGTEIVNPFQQ